MLEKKNDYYSIKKDYYKEKIYKLIGFKEIYKIVIRNKYIDTRELLEEYLCDIGEYLYASMDKPSYEMFETIYMVVEDTLQYVYLMINDYPRLHYVYLVENDYPRE